MWCQAKHLSQKLGRLLAVEFEFSQQSEKLVLFGISKACDELGPERLILILCSWIPNAFGLGKGHWVSRWLQESCRIGRHPSQCCGREIEHHLCEQYTRVIFPKWPESEKFRHVVIWDEEAACVELPWCRFLCSRARVKQSPNSMFNTIYHLR
jgi:hypothetical protein